MKVSDKIAKSPEATRNNKRNNRKPQTEISLRGAAEVERCFKKVSKKDKKDVDRKRQSVLV